MLVVDDQPQILRTLTRFLGSKGYRVETATSVDEALPLLDQRHISAVILDVRMPDRSGLELLAHMREDANLRHVPAVILTGVVLTPEEQALIARHKAQVFFKPKSYEQLTHYLDRVTRQPQPR
ncbi:MAG: response regulator [Acidobacteria bacterium]|nr:response regulator [Acidobacteriota bacterium]